LIWCLLWNQLGKFPGFSFRLQRSWFFVTNSDFLIPIPLKLNVVNLWYFKLMLFDLTEVISKVYDIGIQRYWDEKIRVCCKDSISLLKVLWTQNKMRHFTLRKIASEKGQQFCRTYNLKTLIKLKQFFRFTKIQYFIKALT